MNLLDRAALISRGTRMERLRKSPRRLVFAKVFDIFYFLFGKPITVKARTFWKEDMLVVIPELTSLHIYRYGFFEKGLTKMILEYVKPGMTFFDIGAHFGYYTKLASFLVGKEGSVHSFEPIPTTFNILKANTSHKSNVTLNNCAVLLAKGRRFINDYGAKYSAFNSLYNWRLPLDFLQEDGKKRYEVECISIDDYVQEKGLAPDFIKVDAENSEHEIIRGMQKTIGRFHPVIAVEVGDLGIKTVPTSKELITLLTARGYRPYEFRGGRVVPHTLKEGPYSYDNLLFIHGKGSLISQDFSKSQ